MTARRAIFLTGRREIRERMRSRAFLVGTLVQILIVVGIVVLSAVLDDGGEEYKVGAVGPQAVQVANTARSGAAAIDADFAVKRFGTEAQASTALEDKDVDVVVTERRLLTGNEEPDDALVALLQSASAAVRSREALRQQGLSPDEIRSALSPRPLAVAEVDGGADDGGDGLAFAATLLLYIAILMFGYAVSSGVVEEKSSRVVEIVLSAIRPLHLLAGKVIGIGLLALGQIVVIGVAGIVVSLAVGSVDLPSSTGETAVVVGVFWLLGYAFYACAFAAAGSLVSRQEDSQTTTAPILAIVIASYFAALSALDNPDGGLAVGATFVPLTAPMVVPARAAQGELPLWEFALSVAIMVASLVLVMKLAGRIYERSVLRVGAPVKLREALGRS